MKGVMMSKPFEIGPDDDEIINQLEDSLAHFLHAYSAATGINYWSLMLMVFDISAGALGHVDQKATVSLLDATAKMTKAQGNPPAQVDRRRKAMFRLLERGSFLTSTPKGSA
jgi:hypothetical protein